MDEKVLDYVVGEFVRNNITWITGPNDQRIALKNVTIGELYHVMMDYNGKHMDVRERILSYISKFTSQYELNNKIDEIDDNVKNLNDKINVLIDALSIIDQKIEKLSGLK